MVGVDGTALKRCNRILDIAGLVQGIGVNSDLDIIVVGHGQCAVNRSRRRAPILVEFKPHGAGFELLTQRLGTRGIALAQKTQIHGEVLNRFEHSGDIPRPWCTGSRVGPGGRAGPPAEHGGDAGRQGFGDLLGTDKMNMGINTARGQNFAFSGQNLRSGANDQFGRNALHQQGVTSFADAANPAVFHADVGFDNAPVVNHGRIGNHQIRRALGRGLDGRLPHPVANDLAAAELHLIPRPGVILLDFNQQVGIGQPDPVANGRPEHFGIPAVFNRLTHPSLPSTMLRTGPISRGNVSFNRLKKLDTFPLFNESAGGR